MPLSHSNHKQSLSNNIDKQCRSHTATTDTTPKDNMHILGYWLDSPQQNQSANQAIPELDISHFTRGQFRFAAGSPVLGLEALAGLSCAVELDGTVYWGVSFGNSIFDDGNLDSRPGRWGGGFGWNYAYAWTAGMYYGEWDGKLMILALTSDLCRLYWFLNEKVTVLRWAEP